MKGWSKRELAQRMGYTEKHISQLTSGAASLTEDAALRLERVVGGTARFWLAREAQFREARARAEAEDALREQVGWLKELPMTDMRRWGWISTTRNKVEQVAECLEFFGVANVPAWQDRYRDPLAAFRASSGPKMTPGAVATWIRRGEIEAETRSCRSWDAQGFAAEVKSLRELTLIEDPDEFMPDLVRRCAAHGVAVVTVPAPKGCPAFGMTRWLTPDKALLMLSLRYKTHDHLWFTFFHEAAHLLLHGKRLTFIEGLDGLDEEREEEANAFARDLLIPPADARALATLSTSPDSIKVFARSIGLHPGIVVGRLQHDGLLKFNQRNALKLRYDWTTQ